MLFATNQDFVVNILQQLFPVTTDKAVRATARLSLGRSVAAAQAAMFVPEAT